MTVTSFRLPVSPANVPVILIKSAEKKHCVAAVILSGSEGFLYAQPVG